MNIRERELLAVDIAKSIHGITWPSTYQEPDYVAKLVITLPGEIKKSLISLLPSRKIEVGGAFIHQKPLARFIQPPYRGMKNPELGDLLIVCCEQRSMGKVYNALLLQAKCTTNILRTTIPNDHQFILYKKWPAFEYVKAGHLNGLRRSVCPKTITQGAQYLLIDKNHPSEMFTATVDIPLQGTTCLPCALASVIAFDRGRTIKKNTFDNWSNVIWDLLNISSSAVFNRRKADFNSEPRWSGDSAFHFLLSQSANNDIPVLDGRDDDGKTMGFGVICVDLGLSGSQQ